jgi:hypothetical protein
MGTSQVWALRTYGCLHSIGLEDLWVSLNNRWFNEHRLIKYMPSPTGTQLTITGAYLIPIHSQPFPSIPNHSQPFEWLRMRFFSLGWLAANDDEKLISILNWDLAWWYLSSIQLRVRSERSTQSNLKWKKKIVYLRVRVVLERWEDSLSLYFEANTNAE